MEGRDGEEVIVECLELLGDGEEEDVGAGVGDVGELVEENLVCITAVFLSVARWSGGGEKEEDGCTNIALKRGEGYRRKMPEAEVGSCGCVKGVGYE